jgi:hypothetical protein
MVEMIALGSMNELQALQVGGKTISIMHEILVKYRFAWKKGYGASSNIW